MDIEKDRTSINNPDNFDSVNNQTHTTQALVTDPDNPIRPSVIEPSIQSETDKDPLGDTNTLNTAEPTTQNETIKKPQKSKKKLAIGLLVGAVVLGLGGFGFAYAINNNPENIALSAFSSLFTAKQLSINGTFDVKFNKTKRNLAEIESMQLTVKSDSNEDRENSTTADLSIVYAGRKINLSLGSVILKDYTLYAKIDKIKEAARTILKQNGIDIDKKLEPVEQPAECKGSMVRDPSIKCAPPRDDFYVNLFKAIGKIDGIWWKISIPETIEKMNGLTPKHKADAKEGYRCLTEAFDKAKTKGSDYAKIYQKNAFVKLDSYKGDQKFESKGEAYVLSLDAKKLSIFSSDLAKEIKTLGIEKCLSKINGSSSSEPEPNDTVSQSKDGVSEGDLNAILKEFSEIIVTIDHGILKHELTGFYTSFKDQDNDYNGTIKFNLQRRANDIKAPADSKPFFELYNELAAPLDTETEANTDASANTNTNTNIDTDTDIEEDDSDDNNDDDE